MDQRDRQNLAVAVAVIVLVVAGVWLMNSMRRNGLVEDCLMAHRRNCDALLR
jgi:uncharacterized membrane protein YjjP (DUF1212 family)